MPSHCHTHYISHSHVHLAIIKELNARNSRIAPTFPQHFMFFIFSIEQYFSFQLLHCSCFGACQMQQQQPPHNSIDFPFLAFYFSTLKQLLWKNHPAIKKRNENRSIAYILTQCLSKMNHLYFRVIFTIIY